MSIKPTVTYAVLKDSGAQSYPRTLTVRIDISRPINGFLRAGLLVTLLASASAVQAQSVTPIQPVQAAASGSVSATGALGAMDVSGMQSVGVQLTGAWSGSAYFEVSNDNTTFSITRCYPKAGGPMVNGAGTSGAWECDVNGFQWFRLNVTALAGTVTYALRRSASPVVPFRSVGPGYCLAALCPPPTGGIVR